MPCAFGPTVAQVAVGAKVTFVNGPEFAHLVTGANQAWGSRDAEIQPGGTVSYTFDKAGVYPYACALHRGMSGAIIVGDAVAAAAAARQAPAIDGWRGDHDRSRARQRRHVRDRSTRWTRHARARIGAGLIVGAAIVVVALAGMGAGKPRRPDWSDLAEDHPDQEDGRRATKAMMPIVSDTTVP